jgi:hypothetical protein
MVGCSGLWPPRKWVADSVRTMRIERMPAYLARAWTMTGTVMDGGLRVRDDRMSLGIR